MYCAFASSCARAGSAASSANARPSKPANDDFRNTFKLIAAKFPIRKDDLDVERSQAFQLALGFVKCPWAKLFNRGATGEGGRCGAVNVSDLSLSKPSADGTAGR
jgi:hypothetical protein